MLFRYVEDVDSQFPTHVGGFSKVYNSMVNNMVKPLTGICRVKRGFVKIVFFCLEKMTRSEGRHHDPQYYDTAAV